VNSEDTSLLSGSQPALSQSPRDSFSSTGLPPTLQSSRRGSCSPIKLPTADPHVDSGPANPTSKPGSEVTPQESTSRSDAAPLLSKGTPPARRGKTKSESKPQKRRQTFQPDMGLGMGGQFPAEGVIKTAREMGHEVTVATEPAAGQAPDSSRLPSRPPSVTLSCRSGGRAYSPPPTGSSYQGPVAPELRNPHTELEHSRTSNGGRTDYDRKRPPGWYVPSETDNRSKDEAYDHMAQQALGDYYPPPSHVTLLPGDGPRPGIFEHVTRLDRGDPYPPRSPSHTHQWLSQPPLYGWNGAAAHDLRGRGEPSPIPPAPYPVRPVSRKGRRPSNPTAGSAYGVSRNPSASGLAPSAFEQGPTFQWPHSKKNRSQVPISSGGRAPYPAMGPSVESRSRPYSLASSPPYDRPPPTMRGAVSRAKSSPDRSRRHEATVVLQDDPLTGDRSYSSSSMLSAALKRYEQDSGSPRRTIPHLGSGGTLIPVPTMETSSRPPPPSIHVVPAYTPSPPPSNHDETKLGPPTSMADSRPTVPPATKTKSASSRSAHRLSDSQQAQPSASQQPEGSHPQWNSPPQTRQTAQDSSSPHFRGPPRSSKQLKVSGQQFAMPGLSRVGSREILEKPSRSTQLGSELVDSESSSEYPTDTGSDRVGDYSDYDDDSDGSFDSRNSSLAPRQKIPVSRTADDDNRSGVMRHMDDRRPLAGSGRSSQPNPRQTAETGKSSTRPPPQQGPADDVTTSGSGHIERGHQRGRSRGQMPGRFPEGV